ncbi:MAG: efflux RND transporter periplasmic adaptor subunit [Micropepsaceae bacterium]
MRIVFAALTALALVPLAATSIAQEGGEGPPPAIVVVGAATTERMSETVTVPGSVVSRNDSKIAAEVTGRVEWVAEIGTTVEAGAPIARIDKELLTLQARSAEAMVKRLRARVKFLAQEVARLESLIGKGSTTKQKLDEARSSHEMAEQELADAQVTLERAAYDLAHAEVTAPFSGRVVTRLVQPGEFINRGEAAARIVDTATLDVTAQIPVASVAALKEGDTLRVEGPGGAVQATVRALVPVGDEVSRSAELRAALSDSTWLVGTAVKVATPNGPATEVLSVPRDAVLLRSDGQAVFRIGADNTAELVPVSTGLTSGDRVAVTGALNPGDRVVTRGGETLQAGQKVEIQAAVGAEGGAGAGPG